MFRKFAEGLAFGTGLAIAVIVVYSIWIAWVLPKQMSGFGAVGGGREQPPATITTVPPVVEERYLGSSGVFAGEFKRKRDAVLISGEGRIAGTVSDGDKPVAGLRLRLALNGSVMSQWAVSDQAGRYEIPVPYGEYRIDGFELDTDSANRVLSGRIMDPRHGHFGSTIIVAQGKPGEGLPFRFVPPVEKLGPRGEIAAGAEVIATWKPYPGAETYSVQVQESPSAHAYPTTQIFEWDERPRVLEPSVNLNRHGFKPKPGHYYFVEIRAENDSGMPISETAMNHRRFDFSVARN